MGEDPLEACTQADPGASRPPGIRPGESVRQLDNSFDLLLGPSHSYLNHARRLFPLPRLHCEDRHHQELRLSVNETRKTLAIDMASLWSSLAAVLHPGEKLA